MWLIIIIIIKSQEEEEEEELIEKKPLEPHVLPINDWVIFQLPTAFVYLWMYVDRRVGWLADRLADSLVGWLVGWTSRPHLVFI